MGDIHTLFITRDMPIILIRGVISVLLCKWLKSISKNFVNVYKPPSYVFNLNMCSQMHSHFTNQQQIHISKWRIPITNYCCQEKSKLCTRIYNSDNDIDYENGNADVENHHNCKQERRIALIVTNWLLNEERSVYICCIKRMCCSFQKM